MHLRLPEESLFEQDMKYIAICFFCISMVLSGCLEIFEDEKKQDPQGGGESAIDRKKKLNEMELQIQKLEWENSRLSLKLVTVDGGALVRDKTTGLWHYDVQRNPFTGRAFQSFPNESPRAEADFLLGRKDGMERFWWSNGKLQEEGQWFDGMENGIFRKWNKEGALTQIIRYKNGQITEVILDNR